VRSCSYLRGFFGTGGGKAAPAMALVKRSLGL